MVDMVSCDCDVSREGRDALKKVATWLDVVDHCDSWANNTIEKKTRNLNTVPKLKDIPREWNCLYNTSSFTLT
jgi:hypothetical protein